jgi:hypothetical protein
MAVRKLTYSLVEVLYCGQALAEHREIAYPDQIKFPDRRVG